MTADTFAFYCYTQGHGDPDRCVVHGDIPGTDSIVDHVREFHGLTYEQYNAQRPENAPDHIPGPSWPAPAVEADALRAVVDGLRDALLDAATILPAGRYPLLRDATQRWYMKSDREMAAIVAALSRPSLDAERLARALVLSDLMHRYIDYARNANPEMYPETPEQVAASWAPFIATAYARLTDEATP